MNKKYIVVFLNKKTLELKKFEEINTSSEKAYGAADAKLYEQCKEKGDLWEYWSLVKVVLV